MPNIKAAIKWAKQSEKRKKRNVDVKTRLKTLYKKAKAGETGVVVATESAFDKAAQKGIIHPNKAARKKSRLAKAIKVEAARVQAAAEAPVKKAPAAKRKTGSKRA